jgi:hypothetical protein
VIPSVIESCL